MSSVFDDQILADKLSKLNSSQQCIETLSHWCIFHRSKAEMVAATWDKTFHSSEMAQKVHLLYLANDILQNSKRNGNEFVTEFWKVLPAALKDVNEKGESHGKSVVSRLVNIWEERRVFGSRARNLRDLMLGEQLPPTLDFSKKRSRSVKIMKRDSHSIKTKLTIGGAPEKIVSAFTLVLGDHRNEDQEMSRCKSASQRVRRLEEEVDLACRKAKDPKRKTLSKELEEEENVLRQTIENLKAVEANRQALVSQLQEVLHEQESELENVRTQMQVGLAQAEEASSMRKRLDDENYVPAKKQPTPDLLSSKDVKANGGQASKKTAAAIAAEVADRLAASTSSQYIMTSVLSTFAAEEAKSAGLNKSSSTPNSLPPNPPAPPPVAPPPSNNYQSMTLMPQVAMQTQTPSSQAQFHMVYPSSSLQYLQPSGGMVNSYAYASMPSLPSGRPPTQLQPQPQPQMVMPWTQQQMHMTQQVPPPLPVGQQHQMQMPQQPPAPPSFRPVGLMPPPGAVYYGYPNQSL